MSFSIDIKDDRRRDFSIKNGRLLLCYDVETVIQRLRTRLLKNLGDWYLNRTEGIDYKNKILGFPDKEIGQIFRREILKEKHVERINSFNLINENRNIKITAEIIINGQVAELTL